MNKEKVFAWIESLEDMADQSDKYFVERNELYKENQEKDKEIERLTKIEEEHRKLNGELRKEIEIFNYKINKLDEYLHKMLNATEGKYHLAIQETVWFLNMLKEYKGD